MLSESLEWVWDAGRRDLMNDDDRASDLNGMYSSGRNKDEGK